MRETTECVHPWVYSSFSRRRETALCGLTNGHTWFSHRYLISKDHQPFCDDCLVPQTVENFLMECPSLLELREKYFAEIRFDFREIVNEENLFKFVEEAGFFQKI